MIQNAAKILLVDDEPKNLLALEAVLADLGHKLVRAGSGKEALRQLMREDFAVIILDVQMPGMDGFETASLIRESDRCRHTPIIFLTAVGRSEKDVFHGYEVGAVDYLTKPFVPQILRFKVQVLADLHLKKAEVEDLNRQLTRQAGELEVAVADLEAFAYSVSHDLRAPLRRMAGFSDIMLEEEGVWMPEQSRQYLGMISSNAKRMSRLIDDLLLFSRLGNQPLKMARLQVGELAGEALREVRGQEKHQPEVKLGSLPSALGDATLVRQVFVNLVGNAFKYSRQAEKPEIEIGCTEGEKERVYWVRDNGVGFDMKYADKLFGVFQRLHRQEEFEGSGIGLALVQRIVQRHGGSVWAEAEEGKGAAFFFTLEKA